MQARIPLLPIIGSISLTLAGCSDRSAPGDAGGQIAPQADAVGQAAQAPIAQAAAPDYATDAAQPLPPEPAAVAASQTEIACNADETSMLQAMFNRTYERGFRMAQTGDSSILNAVIEDAQSTMAAIGPQCQQYMARLDGYMRAQQTPTARRAPSIGEGDVRYDRSTDTYTSSDVVCGPRGCMAL